MTNTLNNRSADPSRTSSLVGRVAITVSLSALLAYPLVAMAGADPQTFATPDAAAEALATAARSDDTKALLAVLGDDAEDLVSSGDAVADANARRRFVEAYDDGHELTADGDSKFTLAIGGDDPWPLPVPIVKVGDKWTFDIDEGIDEIVYRRIGNNELGAMRASRGVVEAQKDYAADGHDGLPAGIYAQKLLSDPGKHDGLYWLPNPDERASPIGPFIAEAVGEGYRKGGKGKPAPYHGYVYRLLTAQGPAAPGGAKNYLEGGQLKGGFAVIAYPVEYEVSGVKTFMINQDGALFQKDLGEKTDELAVAVKTFNPDSTWTKVED